jgi:lysophospholipase L1-like esterase
VDSIRFLALGDSYTIGEGVAPPDRWPSQLAVQLRSLGVLIQEPQVVAETGWTTSELCEGIDGAEPRGPFSLVSLLIGVNNQFRGGSIEEYGGEFVDLLQRAVRFAGGEPGRVLVLSVPDWSVTPFAAGRDRGAISRDIDAFNDVNRQETEALGACWIDVTGISREAGTHQGLLAPDGLHPSGEMYALWVEASLARVLEILRVSGADGDPGVGGSWSP